MWVPVDPVALREQFLASHPDMQMPYLPLHVVPGRALHFFVEPRAGLGSGTGAASSADDQFFLDPTTGRVLGSRKWGDLTQGLKNLMPFVYRLHYQMALGVVGTYTFGIVALLWTLDCFIGAYLTLPTAARGVSPGGRVRRKSWLSRWKPAWMLRWGHGAYKLNFDLHRASGLWLWALLFVLGWSSVAFNLPQVYRPVMSTVFAHQPGEESMPLLAHPQHEPRLGWRQALDRGRALMAEQARREGFAVHWEDSLSYTPERGVYRYDVHSSRDLRERGGNTQLYFDANTGALRGVWLPTGGAEGDTVRTWLTSLHMAALWGVPMKLLICAMGLVVVMLSATGVLIWYRKRRARTGAARTSANRVLR